MGQLNKNQMRELNLAINATKELIKESLNKDDSLCYAFRIAEDKEACKRQIRLYVDSWILAPLLEIEKTLK